MDPSQLMRERSGRVLYGGSIRRCVVPLMLPIRAPWHPGTRDTARLRLPRGVDHDQVGPRQLRQMRCYRGDIKTCL